MNTPAAFVIHPIDCMAVLFCCYRFLKETDCFTSMYGCNVLLARLQVDVRVPPLTLIASRLFADLLVLQLYIFFVHHRSRFIYVFQ